MEAEQSSTKLSSTNSSTNTIQQLTNEIDANYHKPPFFGFGIVCCLISGLLFSFNSLCVKLISSISSVQMFAARCFVQFFMFLPIITYGRYSRRYDIFGPPGMFKFLILRGCTGSTAALLLYMAVVNLSLGDAITISYANVFFTSLIAYLCLREAFTLIDGLLCVLTVAGIILIAQPQFIFGALGSAMDSTKIVGILCAIGSAIFSSITMVVVRKLGRETPAILNISYYSFVGSVSTTFILAVTDSFAFPCFSELFFVFLLGILGGGAQIFMTIGLQYERAGTFAVLRSLQIVVIFILQVWVWKNFVVETSACTELIYTNQILPHLLLLPSWGKS